MASTQNDLPIADINNDLVITKAGDFALVIETSAVNFGLLSEREQFAIIATFAGFLNSLSFPIQILIRSKQLDISSYLVQLDQAVKKQENSMLAQMIYRYRNFVEKLIRENEVLDKQFFVVIPLWSYEIGVVSTKDQLKKALNILIPRRDHILRQLGAIGLQSKQLGNDALVELFYDAYNHQPETTQTELNGSELRVETASASSVSAQEPVKSQPPVTPVNINTPLTSGQQPIANNQTPLINSSLPTSRFQYPPNLPQPTMKAPAPNTQKPLNPRTPFVVEELTEDYEGV